MTDQNSKTHATITVKIGNKYHTIYVHWEGYPEYTGRFLYEDFNSMKLAKELISYGDMTQISNDIDDIMYYIRDYNENKAKHKTKVSKSFDKCPKEEYNYLFDGKKWFCEWEGEYGLDDIEDVI